MSSTARRPTPEDLEAALDRKVADVIVPDLGVLFCGINPGRWSAAVGHHFAHPGNRFWKVLHQAGLTPERLAPERERELLRLGMGITNLVARTTASAAELRPDEWRKGARSLRAKVARWHPAVVAVVGVTAFRQAFGRPRAGLGEQPDQLGSSRLWVLPNPSGLQAAYQLSDLVAAYAALRPFVRSVRDLPHPD